MALAILVCVWIGTAGRSAIFTYVRKVKLIVEYMLLGSVFITLQFLYNCLENLKVFKEKWYR
jgi:hypothetical protein